MWLNPLIVIFKCLKDSKILFFTEVLAPLLLPRFVYNVSTSDDVQLLSAKIQPGLKTKFDVESSLIALNIAVFKRLFIIED